MKARLGVCGNSKGLACLCELELNLDPVTEHLFFSHTSTKLLSQKFTTDDEIFQQFCENKICVSK